MIDPIYSQFVLPLIIAIFLAINMGASGTAPSFSAAYGANLIPRSLIPGLFGIMVLVGALLFGKNVAKTLGGSILPVEHMTVMVTSIIMLSVALSLFFANLLGVPQSTSQSTVFALAGPALYFDVLQTNKLFFEIIPTWFILPVIAFFLTYIVGRIIYKPGSKIASYEFQTLKQLPFLQALVIISSLYVALSIGANNVANATGPLASMIMNELGIFGTDKDFRLVAVILVLLITPTFGIGSSLMGTPVMQATGRKLVELGPVSAMVISIITASLLLIASATKGIPTSLVQLNTFAIMAIGCARTGWKSVFKNYHVHKFWVIWIIAPLLAFALALAMTWIGDKMGIL
ncbi:MAG TPA: inorganic phosphate transporter [Bacteroidales bacterium]|nr:inorganic phosphate transporter [Bacteroidales bacterium]